MKRILLVLTLLLFATSAQAASGIQWHSYEDGLARAKASNKPIYLFVHADFCSWCKKMKGETFTDKDVVSRLNENFIAIEIDAQNPKTRELVRTLRVGPIPDNRFLHPDGSERYKRVGFIEAGVFTKVLDILSGAVKI